MKRNIVLIVLDTVRQDYFDDYATRLQERADVDCDACYTASSWTVPSHASMLTGDLPHQHGVHAHNIDFTGIDRSETFFADLPGYQTLGASANATPNVSKGFDELHDEFVAEGFNREGILRGGVNIDSFADESDATGLKYYLKFLKAAAKSETMPSLVNASLVKINDFTGWRPPIARFEDYGARAVIRESKRIAEDSEPFFLYTNFMEAHMPHRAVRAYDSSLYSVPDSWSTYAVSNWDVNNAENPEQYEEYLQKVRELYVASVEYLDRKIVEFVDEIQAQTDRETTFIVTADHGENLGFPEERYALGHNAGYLENSLINVPFLLINAPDGDDEAFDRFSQLDMGPLVTALAENELPDLDRERIPVERIGLAAQDTLSDIEDFEEWDRAQRCVIDEDGVKYKWDSLGNAYRCESDADREAIEFEDLPEWVHDEFEEDLEAYKQSVAGGDGVDEELKEHLEELGYV